MACITATASCALLVPPFGLTNGLTMQNSGLTFQIFWVLYLLQHLTFCMNTSHSASVEGVTLRQNKKYTALNTVTLLHCDDMHRKNTNFSDGVTFLGERFSTQVFTPILSTAAATSVLTC